MLTEYYKSSWREEKDFIRQKQFLEQDIQNHLSYIEKIETHIEIRKRQLEDLLEEHENTLVDKYYR